MKKNNNYLSNKELIKEIHLSKVSYSYYTNERAILYDHILSSEKDINDEAIKIAKISRAESLSIALKDKYIVEKYNVNRQFDLQKKLISFDLTAGKISLKERNVLNAENLLMKKNKLSIIVQKIDDINICEADINKDDIVFRIETIDHIPKHLINYRSRGNEYTKLILTVLKFKPYKHYMFVDGKLTEVGRSHWDGNLKTGKFSTEHGSLTNKLTKQITLLIYRYSEKGSWRGYTFVEEMIDSAMIQVIASTLKFNESIGKNPFAYITVMVKNAFTGIFNDEKEQSEIKSEILMSNGYDASFGKQAEFEIECHYRKQLIDRHKKEDANG